MHFSWARHGSIPLCLTKPIFLYWAQAPIARSPIPKFSHSFPCLKKMLFSLTAPVQSHHSFTLSGSLFDPPCFVRHSSSSLHTESSALQARLTIEQGCLGQGTLSSSLLWASLCSYREVGTVNTLFADILGAKPPQMCCWLSIYLSSITLNSVFQPQDKNARSRQCVFTISTKLFLEWVERLSGNGARI